MLDNSSLKISKNPHTTTPPPQSTANNKRIAKNTLFLYFRMFLMMLVGLYTSRVVLKVLGVDDFGIYNVVGGIVVLFTFINAAMTSATQRFLSYERGKSGEKISLVYSACFNIHVIIAVIIFLLSETIGLWFLNAKMNIPDSRMYAANWVYQMSIITCLVGIIRVPDNSLIIAYEKMSFYAYIGMIEAFLKLAIVFLLPILGIDKLIFYSILLAIISIFISIIYSIKCRRSINDIHLVRHIDKSTYKHIFSFSIWTLFGSLANICLQQGLNIIINVFYGVGLNAAVGIANQVSAQISNLVQGFQQAINPQLTMSVANHDKERQFSLICMSSKLSFYILLFAIYPVAINISYILGLWLGDFPLHTDTICIAILTGTLIDSVSGPLWVTIFATGNVKWYQISVSAILLLIVPISYIGGIYRMSPESMFWTRNILCLLCLFVRWGFLKRYINFDILNYCQRSLFPCIIVAVTLIIPLYFIPFELIQAASFSQFFASSMVALVFETLIILLIGFSRQERNALFHMILTKNK